MDYDSFHQQVYSQDNPPGEAHGWIQWKGTDVCIDLHCKCGHHSHYDGEFLYFFRCHNCGSHYAMGCNVKMIPLNDEQVAHVNAPCGSGFKTVEEFKEFV